MRFELADDGVRMSGYVRFALPENVQAILAKGVPIYFVFETTTQRSRWYWVNKTLSSHRRYIRLMYLPLTRKWRVNSSHTPFGRSNTGVILNQHYDALPAALAAIQRISSWKVLEHSDWDAEADFQIQARFRLDILPQQRPLHIGTAGPSGWNLDWQRTYRLSAGSVAPSP